MKAERLLITFEPITAFEVRCKSATLRGCHRAVDWLARWPAELEFQLECKTTPNQIKTKILAQRFR